MLMNKLKQLVIAPFKWGYNAVDTRPSGSAYRRVSRQVTAVAGREGEVALVVGKGLTQDMPVVEVIKANDPVEAVNATLAFVGNLRRSKAGAINRVSKQISTAARKAAKAQAAAAKAQPVGNAAAASPGPMTPSTEGSGSEHGEALIMQPAGA